MRDLGVGGAGWLAGGWAGFVGVGGGEVGGRGVLGSGATRPWLLPWPPRRLPPPAEKRSVILTISLTWTFICWLMFH